VEPLKIAFLGTPEFAVPSLERLVESGFDIVAVVTQPDKPKGRGKKLAAPPVKEAAIRLGLPVHQPAKVKTPETLEFFSRLGVEAMAVVAYGRIIPQSIIDLPPLGLINVHSSLLPKYRGAAPMQWAVAEGETLTGVTTMQIDAGLDSGDILLACEAEIGPDETAVELSERLAAVGADLLVRTLRGVRAEIIEPKPQDHEKATFAPMLTKEAGRIDWKWPAARIHNRVRGFQPWPGAYTSFRGQSLHIWRSRLIDAASTAAPGALVVEGRRLIVGCGSGAGLELVEVQMEGRKQIPALAFANGQRLTAGEILGGN
jgi:methionyl-tRNA formyltransferase